MFRILSTSAFLTVTRSFLLTVSAGLHSSSTKIWYTFKGTVWNPSTQPLPPTLNYYAIPMVAIYSSDFIPLLLEYIKTILSSSSHTSPVFNFIIEAQLKAGAIRTVGHGLRVDSSTNFEELEHLITGYIEGFETQSGTPEERQPEEVVSSLVKVFDRSNAPNVNWENPLELPKGFKEPEAPKTRPSRKNTEEKLSVINSQINTLQTTILTSQAESTKQIVEAIKSNQSSPNPSLLSGVNWAPLVHGLVNVVITQLGGSPVSFPSAPVPTNAKQTPAEAPVVSNLPQVEQLIESRIAPLLNKVSSLESALTSIAKSQGELSNTVSELAQSQGELTNTVTSQLSELAQNLNTFVKATGTKFETLNELISSSKSPQGGNGENGGGTSSAPVTPIVNEEPISPNTSCWGEKQHLQDVVESGTRPLPEDALKTGETFNKNSPLGVMSNIPEIETLTPTKKSPNLTSKIVAADLEALILPNGNNKVYMASWYNGEIAKVYDITQYGNNTNTMLVFFWQELINQNNGSTVYFHNFGGYDAILSLPALLELPFTFSPVMKDGEIISIKVLGRKNKLILEIKDSIRILPGALAKLAKDWGAETQKDHFPHYFWKDCVENTLRYIGPIPAYTYFEPKRTSPKDYKEMVKIFENRYWSFLEVSKTYILGDVKATYQILTKYFETLISKFPIDPLAVYSAPSAAFRIWRTTQLPLLNQDGLKVYDLSHNLDSELRSSYCGGIVDVYRPHLVGEGYYYDVNSLYPTAMCKPMPVGMPTLEELTVNQFLEGNFYGFIEALIEAPANEYIGLLPIKYQGKLICPGGTFKGIFFSEELRFALNNGYQLLGITKAYSFKRGTNTFLQLITQLNEMKITAQLNKQPTIRNLAKLLMNSMYGRFGMHPSLTKHQFIDNDCLETLNSQWQMEAQIDFGNISLVTLLLNQEWILKNKGKAELIKDLNELGNKTNVAIASAVTAHSRMIINQYKLLALSLGLELYYSDTDSLVLNGPLPSKYLDSASLGKLKLEHKIKEGIFVMPKVYFLETEEGIVTKCKGFAGKLTKAQYLELLEGKAQHLEVTKWSKSLAESSVKIQIKQPYKLTFSFNKREQVFNAQGQWVNTKPLELG